MKLNIAVELAKACGLSTYGEAMANINHKAMNIFSYDKISEELKELNDDFQESGFDFNDKF